MTNHNYNGEKIRELIDNAQNIAVIPSEVAGADSFCAAAGLYHALDSQEKNASLVYVAKIPEEAQNVIDPEKLTEDIYTRKLTIDIDYSDTPASKLAYSNEGNTLKLVLSPISQDFDRSRIRTNIEGYKFDLIFVMGVQTPEDLGQVYRELREEFSNATLVNLDNTGMNMNHGSINIVDRSASNLSEVVFKLLSAVGIVPDAKAAKALLTGMTYRAPKM